MSLTREQLLARNDRKLEVVVIGSDEVTVRSLTAREQLALEKEMDAAGDNTERKVAAELSALICDEAGNAILSTDDAMLLLNQSAELFRAVIKAGTKLNGWGKDVKGN